VTWQLFIAFAFGIVIGMVVEHHAARYDK